MRMTKDQIRSEAMQLEPAEREALAEELLQSVSGDQSDAIDAAWLAEAHRREASHAKGKTTARPVDDVISRLRQKRS